MDMTGDQEEEEILENLRETSEELEDSQDSEDGQEQGMWDFRQTGLSADGPNSHIEEDELREAINDFKEVVEESGGMVIGLLPPSDDEDKPIQIQLGRDIDRNIEMNFNAMMIARLIGSSSWQLTQGQEQAAYGLLADHFDRVAKMRRAN